MQNTIKLLIVSVAFFGVACTQTVILYKPKANIDPMPSEAACPEVDKEDPKFGAQWSLAKVGVTADMLKKGSDVVAGNANVRVAILSTGIDYNHEDLCGQVSVNKKEITQKAAGDRPDVNREDDDGNGLVDDIVGYDVVDGDGLAYDRQGAGTAVAGIIAANQRNGIGIAGLMKRVTLIPIRYIDNNGQTSVAALGAAIDAALKLKPHVIYIQTAQIQLGGWEQNPELIGQEIGMLRTFFDRARDSKIPIVVGAGDDMSQFGTTEMDKMLKSYENVFIVTAMNKSGQRSLLANSNNQDVIVAAPGEDVLTLKPGNKYGTVSGTGFAAAHVAAALGLARAQLADRLDMQKVITALVSSKGSDASQELEPHTRGGTSLQIAKFISLIKAQ